MNLTYIAVLNNQSIAVDDIPVSAYDVFFDLNTGFVQNSSHCHCVSYFGYRVGPKVKLICCIADDGAHLVYLSSCMVDVHDKLPAFSANLLSFEKFEREIHENFGIDFVGHPWLKPLRYAFDRADKSQTIDNYPFYRIDSEELHEVGVGPIHAGIIEPGHFRFICNGEQILHLEIQLGYQHRGVEHMFLRDHTLLQRTILAESIAGDTVVGHTVAFSNLWESLCGFQATPDIDFARALALELERIAIHTGDLSGICADVAYQLGNSVFGRLRTPIVNFMQEWGGNRLSKGLIRPARNPFPFTNALGTRLNQVFDAYERDFNEMADKLFGLPSALSRFERTGAVSYNDGLAIGTVGMSARMCGLARDVRMSHPYGLYRSFDHSPVVLSHGDVFARVDLRRQEVGQSMAYIRHWLDQIPDSTANAQPILVPKPNSFVLSMVEGWRGEICHCAVTGPQGELVHYKVKDPSFHNWLALALAVRNNEISDFPICNKSFNLSYSGHDL